MVSPSETAVRLSRRRGRSVAPPLTVVLSLSVGCCPKINVPEPVVLKAEIEKDSMQFYSIVYINALTVHWRTSIPVRDTVLPLSVTPPLIA